MRVRSEQALVHVIRRNREDGRYSSSVNLAMSTREVKASTDKDV